MSTSSNPECKRLQGESSLLFISSIYTYPENHTWKRQISYLPFLKTWPLKGIDKNAVPLAQIVFKTLEKIQILLI
jgi:hypothetical protein